MIDILKNIFKDKQYINIKEIDIKNEKYILYKNSNQNKKEFFILSKFKYNEQLNLNSLLILNKVEELFSNMLDLDIYDPEMDKNTSMIICIELDNLKQEKRIENIIYDVEEDPYYFKKYTITYTTEQVEKYNTDISKKINNDNVLKLIENEITDYEKFVDFKYNIYSSTLYNLLSKLYIKIPFLNYNFQPRNIENLEKNISDDMSHEIDQLHVKLLDIIPDIIDQDFNIENLINETSNYEIFNMNDMEEYELWEQIYKEIKIESKE